VRQNTANLLIKQCIGHDLPQADYGILYFCWSIHTDMQEKSTCFWQSDIY